MVSIRLKRGDLEGSALSVFIPRGVGARHWSDEFSRELLLAKVAEDTGKAFVIAQAPGLAALVPAGTERIAVPPPGRRRVQRPWYMPGALAEEVAALLEVGAVVRLQWRPDRGGCVPDRAERLEGRAVCVVDDYWLTGLTAEQSAAGLYSAGASSVTVACLGSVERTADRPEDEQAIARLKTMAKRARAPAVQEEPGAAAAWKAACLARDGGRCLVCGSRDLLTVHHVLEQGARPDLRRAVANGRTVCSGCHQWVHSIDGKRQALTWLAEVLGAGSG